MPKEVKQAYNAFTNQKQRCYNKKRPDYAYYGALGVEVRYTVRDFIGWYLYHLSRYEFEKPSVGRIDHSGNYEFSNIQLIEMLTNISERVHRRGRPLGDPKKQPKKVYLKCPRTNEIIAEFPSTVSAAKNLGYTASQISRLCLGQTPKSKRFNFKFSYG